MKKIASITMVFLFTIMFGISSFATPTGNYATNSQINNPDAELGDNGSSSTGINIDADLPNVTIQDAEQWTERKGFELIGLLQKFVQPFAIIIFILSAFLSLAGAFGNSQLVGRGIFGMFIAIIMYAVVLYAPEIMDGVFSWLIS